MSTNAATVVRCITSATCILEKTLDTIRGVFTFNSVALFKMSTFLSFLTGYRKRHFLRPIRKGGQVNPGSSSAAVGVKTLLSWGDGGGGGWVLTWILYFGLGRKDTGILYLF